MQIRQLQVAHDGQEDRLLLRIATQADEEIRAWITRRFLRELWTPLVTLLLDHLAVPAALEDDAESAAPAGHFDEPFHEEQAIYPLGRAPLLVSEVKMEATGPKGVRMTLREGRERSFAMHLNGELVQALCAMLRATSQQAGWDLSLEYGTAPAAKPLRATEADAEALALPTTPPKSRLH